LYPFPEIAAEIERLRNSENLRSFFRGDTYHTRWTDTKTHRN